VFIEEANINALRIVKKRLKKMTTAKNKFKHRYYPPQNVIKEVDSGMEEFSVSRQGQ
jgi:hypothetical protein